MNYPNILVLTDQPLKNDRRVLNVKTLFVGKCSFLVLSKQRSFLSNLLAYILFPFFLLLSIRILFRIKDIVKKESILTHALFDGLKGLIVYCSRVINFYLMNKDQLRSCSLIYANDQLCGLIALINYKLNNVPYFYDCHEVVPFRARKVGLLRMGIEALFEKYIIKYAEKVYLVNRKINYLYSDLYLNKKYLIRNNNFYKKNIFIKKTFLKKAILYIGATPNGRHIKKLINKYKNSDIEILLAISDKCDFSIYKEYSNIHYLDFKNYEKELMRNYQDYMIYMWMSFDVNIYSYRLSLPNKFFQALAFGFPIIVSKNTYLEEIVNKYNIGMISNSNTLECWKKDKYLFLHKNVLNLLDKIMDSKSIL